MSVQTAQKISPETKEKVQLQVILHDNSANTFLFTNPGGRPSQKQDREAVKELLQQLLPRFKRKISSELEEKNRCVSRLLLFLMDDINWISIFCNSIFLFIYEKLCLTAMHFFGCCFVMSVIFMRCFFFPSSALFVKVLFVCQTLHWSF